MKFLLSVVLALVAIATTPPLARAAAAAAAENAAIAPFITEGTVLVGRLDIERLDLDAFKEYAGSTLESFMKEEFKEQGMDEADMAPMVQMVKDQIGVANTWMTDMSAAGGKHVYVLVEMTDIEDDDAGEKAIAVVPLGDGADAEKIRALFSSEEDDVDAGDGDGEVKVKIEGAGEVEAEVEVEADAEDDGSHKAVQIGKAVVFAPPKAIERLKKQASPGSKPVARPDLLAALAAAGDAPARLVFAPSEKMRKLIEEKFPTLPEPFGSTDSKIVSRGMRWASLGILQKPTAHARLAVRGQDAQQAKTLLDTLNKWIDVAKDATAGQDGLEERHKQLAEINPKLDAETITLDVDAMLFLTGMKDIGENMGEAVVEVDEDVDDDAEVKPAKKDDGGL